MATTAYARCGRKQLLDTQQRSAIVEFVKRWRSKRFCTAAYIVQELKLTCSKKIVIRTRSAREMRVRVHLKCGMLHGK